MHEDRKVRCRPCWNCPEVADLTWLPQCCGASISMGGNLSCVYNAVMGGFFIVIVSLSVSWRSNAHGCHVTSVLGWAFRLGSVNNVSVRALHLFYFIDRNMLVSWWSLWFMLCPEKPFTDLWWCERVYTTVCLHTENWTISTSDCESMWRKVVFQSDTRTSK